MQKKIIRFKKNTFSILVMYLHDMNYFYFKDLLLKKIQESPIFFQKTPIILDIKKLSYSLNWVSFKHFVLSSGCLLIGISGCLDKKVKKKILQSGLLIFYQNNNPTCYLHKDIHLYSQNNITQSLSLKKENRSSFLLDKLVRSGQKIYVPGADLIITNNVSSGAEVIADGNIHIYGIMRGRVLAGASGDGSKKIFCTKLFAELISIDGEYLTIEQIPIQFLGKSVEISLINKKIYIKSLN